MDSIKIAIPSDKPGGLEAPVSAHFGHCDLYTIVEMDENGIKSVSAMDNPPHEEGGCLAPIQLLAQKGVGKLLAGGMGRRPLAGFNQAGIQVFLADSNGTVGKSLQALLDNKLPLFSLDSVCGGCGEH